MKKYKFTQQHTNHPTQQHTNHPTQQHTSQLQNGKTNQINQNIEKSEKEENKQKAFSVKLKNCPMCNFIFPPNFSVSDLNSHIYKCLN